MSRFRLFLAWLVMAALPLQGFAAASMLSCGMAQASKVSQAGALDGHAHPAAEASAGHDGHAMRAHATHAPASHDGTHSGAGPGAGHGVHGDHGKSAHSCPVCASCCQVAAVSGFQPLPMADPVPDAEPPQPVVRMATRTTTVPDKPPRA
jgi:hypothetical protein